MTDHKQGGAGSGQHTPKQGEEPHKKAHKHDDTGEHKKNTDKVHHDTAPDSKGTAKYPN